MASKTAALQTSPLSDVDYRFKSYLTQKKSEYSKHMLGNGIPDYAYRSDYEYRKKLDSVPGLYNIAKKIYSTTVTQELHMANMQYLSVGPDRFPEVYQIGCECAKRLGIGVPNIYIDNSDTLNAYTYATDDVEPFIVVTNLMLKRMTLGELKAVIGHECGHVHNYHGTYSGLSRIILSNGAGIAGMLFKQLQFILTQGIILTLNMWSRAAEVTADRAALICCDNIEDAYSVNKKLLYGAVDVNDKIDADLDMESLREQMQLTMDNPSRLMELFTDHPLSIKRIFAEMEFSQCEIFYKWRPELRKPGQIMRSKETVDERCRKYIDVIKGKGDRR